jgi:hypothetical protein
MLLALAACPPTDTPPTDGGDTDAVVDTDDTDPAGVATDDGDDDGFTTADGDCDDSDPTRHPGAFDLADDGIDQNCDGVDGVDADGDGDAATWSGGDDCNDDDPGLHGLDVDQDGRSWCDGDCDDDDVTVGAVGMAEPCPRVDGILALEADAGAGAEVFRRACQACHDPAGLEDRVGPALSFEVPPRTDADLVSLVIAGVQDMEPQPGLPDHALADVLAWMRATWP